MRVATEMGSELDYGVVDDMEWCMGFALTECVQSWSLGIFWRWIRRWAMGLSLVWGDVRSFAVMAHVRSCDLGIFRSWWLKVVSPYSVPLFLIENKGNTHVLPDWLEINYHTCASPGRFLSLHTDHPHRYISSRLDTNIPQLLISYSFKWLLKYLVHSFHAKVSSSMTTSMLLAAPKCIPNSCLWRWGLLLEPPSILLQHKPL